MELAPGEPDVEEPDDVGMFKLPEDARLAEEAAQDRLAGGDGRLDHLQGHGDAVGLAAGEVDHAHPPFAQRPIDPVAVEARGLGPVGRLDGDAGRRRDRVRRASASEPGRLVVLDGEGQDRLARLDRVAVAEVRGVDPLAVDADAVGARHVHQAARGRVDLDQEVDPGEGLVAQGEAELDLRRAADEEGVVLEELERRARVRPFDDGERDFHAADSTRPDGGRGRENARPVGSWKLIKLPVMLEPERLSRLEASLRQCPSEWTRPQP